MKKILSLCAVVFLVGCSGIPIDNQLYASKSTLTILDTGATGYVEQPLCGSPDAKEATLCSKPSVIKKIKMASKAANTSLDAAFKAKTEETLKQAQTAVEAFLKIYSDILTEK
jgi:hypothetical protein